MRWSVALAVLVFAGCLGSGNDPAPVPAQGNLCDPPGTKYVTNPHFGGAVDTTPRPGNGSFVLHPADPVLTPGLPLVLNVTFHDPDCRPYGYLTHDSCHHDLIRVGEHPVRVDDWTIDWGPLLGEPKGCLDMPVGAQVEPGQTLTRQWAWNGSFMALVAEGSGWRPQWVHAAPGQWPLRYGPDAYEATYPTRKDTVLVVLENALNQGSLLHPDHCVAAPPRIMEAEVDAWPLRPEAGQRVRIWLNHTVRTDAACTVQALPHVGTTQGAHLSPLLHGCRQPLLQTALVLGAGDMRIRHVAEWDGAQEPCLGGEVRSGAHTLYVDTENGRVHGPTVEW